jgi:outer membrane usher protein
MALVASAAAQFALAARGPASGGFAASAADSPGAATADAQLLAVRLNGAELDDVVTTLHWPGQLAIPESAWQQFHLRPPTTPAVIYEGQSYHLLSAIAGLTWRVDAPSQSLVIDAPPAAFAGLQLKMDTAPVTPSTSAFGGYANYDVQWQRSSGSLGGGPGRDFTNGLIEVGAFHDGGSLRMTGLLRDGGTAPQRVRLDTSWTHDEPSKMASLRVGDSIGRAGAWGRAVRFGGVQWSTDFSTQPGFLSFPLPTMQGQAALPSTVDVYVNNSLRSQSQVPAGPFDLTDVPIVTGQGQVRMVVRDLLGREQVVLQPYYVSPALLRPGLRAFSYEVGAVREDYGLASTNYGRAMATVTEKLGISENFTRELRGEVIGDQVSAGATGIWMLPSLGVMNLSLVGSHGPQGPGALVGGGSEYQGGTWSGSLQGRYSSRDFRQLGQSENNAPRAQYSAALGTAWQGAALGASLIEQRGWQGDRTRILSLNAGRDLGGMGTLGVFLLRDFVNHATTAALSFSRVLDARTSANVTNTRNRDAQRSSQQSSLQLQRNAPDNEGLGYQMTVDRGDSTRANAQAVWQGEKVALSAGFARARGSDDMRLGASGGLAMLGDSVFVSRRIEGSFAVVEVGDYENVQVLHDHRPVARTDSRGRALVSGLRGYEPNRIGVNAADLPFDAEVDGLDVMLVPPGRSGTALKIPVNRTRAASFRLIGVDGQPLPPGSLARVAGNERAFPVGFDGKAYVTGLSARTQLLVTSPERECRATLVLESPMEEVPELGTLRCQ